MEALLTGNCRERHRIHNLSRKVAWQTKITQSENIFSKADAQTSCSVSQKVALSEMRKLQGRIFRFSYEGFNGNAVVKRALA